MENAVVYARYSSHNQTEQSIEGQLAAAQKYAGTYRFRDLVYKENAIPAIITKEQFDEVQRMKQLNRRKPSRKWNYSDYLLTEKLFCGVCGRPVIGKSGYGKLKVKYEYYTCLGKIEKICELKP